MDPTFELIAQCMQILKDDPAVSGFVSDRVYDRIPAKQDGTINVTSPYISLGATSLFTEDIDCIDSTSINIQFHCWSWGANEAYSSVEVRKLAFAVRKALHKAEVPLDDNGFVSLQHQTTAYNRASDGVTNQASLTFEALVDIIS